MVPSSVVIVELNYHRNCCLAHILNVRTTAYMRKAGVHTSTMPEGNPLTKICNFIEVQSNTIKITF